MNKLTRSTAMKIFEYNRSEGNLYWKLPTQGNRKKGAIAGCPSKKYYQTKILNRWYYVHRIIWLIETGKMPVKFIDHIDGNTLNNKIENLREVTVRENANNHLRHRKGRLVGASYDKRRGYWYARIDGRWLGVASSEEDANSMYLDAKRKIVMK